MKNSKKKIADPSSMKNHYHYATNNAETITISVKTAVMLAETDSSMDLATKMIFLAYSEVEMNKKNQSKEKTIIARTLLHQNLTHLDLSKRRRAA